MKYQKKTTNLFNKLKDDYLSPNITIMQLPNSQNILTTLSNEMEIDDMEDLGTWEQ